MVRKIRHGEICDENIKSEKVTNVAKDTVKPVTHRRIYRIVEYFSLVSTHSIVNLTLGYTILGFVIINCLTSLHLLLTSLGYCADCDRRIYDWRLSVLDKLNETDVEYTTYVYAMSFIISFFGHQLLDNFIAATLAESFLVIFLMCFGYILVILLVKPKLICEAMLHLRRLIEYKPKVARIVAEVERRNSKKNAASAVESFYSLIWRKRSGITHIPEIFAQLPRYIRLEISLNLFWQVFYHSPTFRSTSLCCKRSLCDFIHLDYKLPGERFFTGPQAQTHLYYLKSGIVQLISMDDGTTALLSMTGGTIFGDISFFLPPLGRSVFIQCVTYCEVFFISRMNILNVLSKFPEDRRKVLKLAKGRLEHAMALNKCKENARGQDRVIDEDLQWLKQRWWEIYNKLDKWKKRSSDKVSAFYELSQDDVPYHCVKYIGQIVLCTEAQLHRKSMFAKYTFPWILLPNTPLSVYWHRLVAFVVCVVLLLFPPNLSRNQPFPWFHFVQFRTDCIYCLDIAVLLCTALSNQEVSRIVTFSDVLFARFKTFSFWLDVLATVWIEELIALVKMTKYVWISMYNRLLKIKILFISEVPEEFNYKVNIILRLILKICLILFCYCYVGGFIFLWIERNSPSLTTRYWMGDKVCPPNITKTECNPDIQDVMYMSFAWIFNVLFSEYYPLTLMDTYFAIFVAMTTNILEIIGLCTLIGAIYLSKKDVVEYQYFVTRLKQHYKVYKIHPNLMMRLDAYLVYHWKYFNGMDVMKPQILKNEPFDIYWHAHGEIAVKIISSSGAFKGADSAMLRELAYKSKFLLRPRNTTIALFGALVKNVTWLAQGWITCEYHDTNGEIKKKFIDVGSLISPTGVFLGTASFRTYTTYTECETIYIKRSDFTAILKRYPNEWSIIEGAVKEYGEEMQNNHDLLSAQHADYESNLQERIFHARMNIYKDDNEGEKVEKSDLSNLFGFSFRNPESKFVQIWCMVRAITALVLIINASLLGVTGTTVTLWSEVIQDLAIVILVVDIGIKFNIGYYNKDGILVTDCKARAIHYATRTLCLDLLGVLPISRILNILEFESMTYEHTYIVNSVVKLITQMYVVVGYMNYLADSPSRISVYLQILKWQVVLMLLRFVASQFFFSMCFTISRDVETNAVTMERRESDKCWLPNQIEVNAQPTLEQQHLVLLLSFILTECGMRRLNLGLIRVRRPQIKECIVLATLALIFWFVSAYTVAVLCLCKRTNANFRHGVTKLREFLQAERVDRTVVDQVLAHFKYLWIRTEGANLEGLMQERIGVVFRRDLSYFFFSRTLHGLNTLLKGDENMLRRISGVLTTEFFMKGEHIIRQDDLNKLTYVVHRGAVGISIDGEEVAVLTKGSIFGLLDGTKARPSRIMVYALEHTDLMQMQAEEFEDVVDNHVLSYIRGAYTTLQQDYIKIKRPIVEDPRNTIPYLIRGKKVVQLPWMKQPVDAHKGFTWYRMWLNVMWVAVPVSTSFVVTLINTMPLSVQWATTRFLFFSDFLHAIVLVVDFFTLKVVIVDDKCVYRRYGFAMFRDLLTYLSIFSIVAPLLTFFTNDWTWQCARVVRLWYLYNYHSHFCNTFRTSMTPAIMKILYVLLILHAVTVGWMLVACNSWDSEHKFLKPEYYEIPKTINQSIDYNEWTAPENRFGFGCKRITIPKQVGNTTIYSYLVAKYWQWDYLVAFNYIIIIYTQTDWDMVVPFNIAQTTYNCIITFVLYLLSMWVISLAISYMYMNMRQLYKFDYNIQSLRIYLEHAGLSSTLLKSVVDYTSQLWSRQGGKWLPGLAFESSICLQEDILGALYMHHFESPPLFRHLPPYILRQLVTKIRRIVIFPGKCVVKQSDVYPCIYFIHEGEVEKWQTDPLTGERKLVAYLFTCDYFGLWPGLFPTVPHSSTYITRTVTDFVILMYKDWQDLREGYPEIKERFYEIATQYRMKEKLSMQQATHTNYTSTYTVGP